MRNILKIFSSKSSLKDKILNIVNDIKEEVNLYCDEKFWINWYGAYDVDPKHLVIWICVQKDKTKADLIANKKLHTSLRNILTKHNYPKQAISSVYIGFESEETVSKESGGDWYQHFK